VESYLLSPHDLRPSLIATMPRLSLTKEEASAIAAYVVPDQDSSETPHFTEAQITRGSALYDELRCDSCHAFASVRASAQLSRSELRTLTKARLLAPDLIHARSRVRPNVLARWIRNP